MLPATPEQPAVDTAETIQIDTKASTGTAAPTKLSALTVIAYI
jgi:hypothetical protein